jgi:hypothetical protein
MSMTSTLARRVSGRSVALVGNARSLSTLSLGKEIDSCELVIRLNSAPNQKIGSHGARTSWIASSMLLSPRRLQALKPERLIWMSPRRRVLAIVAYGALLPMSFYPGEWWHMLAARLGGARPSTGAMVIDLIVRLGEFSELRLFGFDFFQSGSLSQRGLTSPPPHDFAREREYVSELLHSKPRITLVSGATGCA